MSEFKFVCREDELSFAQEVIIRNYPLIIVAGK